MFRLSRALIVVAFVLFFLFASPQVQACPAPSPESLLFDSISEPPPDADVIAEVIFEGNVRIAN
jgi:hypothetical protein